MALRYFNAAGADEESGLDERHHPETHLIPIVLQAALGLRPDVTIFGTDYDTPDGTCIRDYVHVLDLCDAHVAALDHFDGGGCGGVFNLGTGRGHSVREVIDMAMRVSGRRIVIREGRTAGRKRLKAALWTNNRQISPTLGQSFGPVAPN